MSKMVNNRVLMFPVAGLSFADVSMAAMECHGNRVRTARRLGVGERSLDAAIEREGLERWFVSGRGNGRRPRPTCVSREQVVELAHEGYIRRDVAFILGISPAYLKDLIKKWNIADEFVVRKGRAAAVAVRGYCS